MSKEISAYERIVLAATQEFLQKGFQGASLRHIATYAGMTTGAIYTYFADKEALFDTVVAPVYTSVENIFSELSKSYYNENTIVCEITFEKSVEDLRNIYCFIYKHIDLFTILLSGSHGSKQANFIHMLVDYEVAHTMAYLQRLAKSRNIVLNIDTAMIHTISEGYINALFEPVRHAMSLDEALKNLEFLVRFYTGGWQSICNEFLK